MNSKIIFTALLFVAIACVVVLAQQEPPKPSMSKMPQMPQIPKMSAEDARAMLLKTQEFMNNMMQQMKAQANKMSNSAKGEY